MSDEELKEEIKSLIEQIKAIEKTLEIAVEGNIGSGKSSLLRIFECAEDVETIQEGVKIWEMLHILEDFYKNPKANALLFQVITFATRLALFGRKRKKKIIVFERTVWADRYCFAENLAEDGIMSQKELKVYQLLHRILINGHLNKTVPDVIIYLRASPETSKRRQEARGRKSESTIPLEYFQKLHDKHERWLLGSDEWSIGAIGIPSHTTKNTDGVTTKEIKFMRNAPVFVIDVDNDYENENEYKVFILRKLLEVLTKYGKTTQEREEFNNKLEVLSQFPDEGEIIDFVKQLNEIYSM